MVTTTNHTLNRYSEEDLSIFKILLEQKLAKAESEKVFLIEQIESINDNEKRDADWMDDTSTSTDLEMLYTQASRLSKNIRDIKNALIRVHNKSYGVCIVTGFLIDKRRLLAVPTTTKSLEGKTTLSLQESKPDQKPPSAKPTIPSERKIFSRIISGPSKPEIEGDNDDYEDFDLNFDLEEQIGNTEEYNEAED